MILQSPILKNVFGKYLERIKLIFWYFLRILFVSLKKLIFNNTSLVDFQSSYQSFQ